MYEYEVKQGESLRSISEKFDTDEKTVARINKLNRKNKHLEKALQQGSHLDIPVVILRKKLCEYETLSSLSESLEINTSNAVLTRDGEIIYIFPCGFTDQQ